MPDRKRPDKPADSPLYPHACGKWAKRIGKKIYYFGRWEDHDAALLEYVEQLPYLKVGKKPPSDGRGYTVRNACEDYYDYNLARFKNGEIGARHLNDIDSHNLLLISILGKDRNLDSLTPVDFSELRDRFADRYGLVRLSNAITKTKALFNWCFESQKIPAPIVFGTQFVKPKKAALRRARQSQPKRLFTSDEIHSLLSVASTQTAAFILLGLNGGCGQTDISSLEHRHIQDGWVDFPRPKTGVARSFPLWPETIEAIENAQRPDAKPKYRDHVFVTRFGVPWVRVTPEGGLTDAISREFTKLRNKAGITAKGKTFYSLRHTFRTVADECRDQPAVFHIMGHADQTIADVYRETIAPSRLIAVTEYVRNWLFDPK